MGYITSGATVYIDCFLTQKGKELFFIGEDEDIIVKYFSLGDSDTNYVITNNLNITTQDDNVLTEGFIPSISGNYDECAKSIAGGIKLKFEIPICLGLYIVEGVGVCVFVGVCVGVGVCV